MQNRINHWQALILGLLVILSINFVAPIAFGQGQNVTPIAAEKRYRPELVIQTGHTSLVNTVVFSPDGKILASGGGDNAVRLWDVKTGRQIKSLAGHTGYLLSVAFSPDGKTLASSSFDNTIKLWDVETGAQIKSLEGHTGYVFSVAFSPDGRTLASGSYDNTIKLWNVGTGAQIKSLEGHTGFVFSVAFSPDGRTLASGNVDNSIRLWDVATGNHKSLLGHAKEVSSVAFSPDGKTLASGSFDNTIKLWDVETGAQIKSLEGHASLIYSIAFSPDGKTLASGDGVHTIKLWDVETKRESKSFAGDTTSYIKSIAFSPDGKTLASGSGDNAIKLWDVETGAQTKLLKGHATHILSVAVSPDGKKIASGSFDNTIKLWDVTGQVIKSLSLVGHADHVVSVVFSPDGKTLASGSKDNTIKLWNVDKGQQLKSFAGHTSWVYSVAFSPDGKTLASGSEDNNIKLWNVQTGEQIKSLVGHTKGVHAVAFSPDGKTLASGSSDNTIKLWNVETGEQIKTLEGHTHEVLSIAFSPDKVTLASGSQDKTIKLWNVQTGQPLKSLIGHVDKVNSVAFSPDGRTLASGGENSIKLWDAATGNHKSLVGHAKEVSSVTFLPNKNQLLSSSWDATVKLWRTDSDTAVATLISLDKDDFVVVTPDGRFDASKGALNLMHYVYGLEVIDLEQLKEGYYEPVLLQKLLGFSNDPLRTIVSLKDVKLHPEILEQQFDERSGKLSIKLKSRSGGIGQVQVFVNGKRVVEDARDEKLIANPNIPLNAVVTLTVNLQGASFLSGKNNTITVVTSNYLKDTGKGNIQSRGTEMVYLDKGQEEFTLPSLYAIVGGVSDYDGTDIDLRFAAKDAEDFSNALALGAKRLFCPKENLNCLDKVQITTLSTNRQSADEQPTKENFKKAFAGIAQKARLDDIVVIYLAGHGVTLGQDTDTYFYLTKEARSASKDVVGRVYQTAAISNLEMTDWLTLNQDNPNDIFVKAQKLVLILDTCAAGNFAENESWKIARDLTGDQIRAMEFLKGNTSTFILMGSAANKPSYEASKYNQGLLTYALLEGMRGASLQQERVDVRRLFDYAESRVPALAKDMTLEQKPIIKEPPGNTFPIGQMTDSEKRQINLPSPKPLMLRPLLTNPEKFGADNLKLIPGLRKRFDAESSYEVMRRSGRGEPTFIYIDDDSIPGALHIAGTYIVEGDKLRVRAILLKDGQPVATLPEIFTTKEKVLDELLPAIHLELAKNRGRYQESTTPEATERLEEITVAPKPETLPQKPEPNVTQSGSVTGKWNMIVTVQNTRVPVTLELKQDGGAVSGTFSSHAGNGIIPSGNVSGNTITAIANLTVNKQIIELKLDGTIDGDKMSGSLITRGLPPFSFTATKAK